MLLSSVIFMSFNCLWIELVHFIVVWLKWYQRSHCLISLISLNNPSSHKLKNKIYIYHRILLVVDVCRYNTKPFTVFIWCSSTGFNSIFCIDLKRKENTTFPSCYHWWTLNWNKRQDFIIWQALIRYTILQASRPGNNKKRKHGMDFRV